MRIAYVNLDPGIPPFGVKGASVHVQEVIREMRSLGHSVTLYTVRSGQHVPADLADLEVRTYALAAKDGLEREAQLLKLSDRVAKDVIASGTEFLYERYSLFSTVLAKVSGTLACPSILEVNAPLIDEQKEHRFLGHEAAARHALIEQSSSATACVCVSDRVKTWVQQVNPAATAVTIPNGVSLRRITPAGEDKRQAVVTFVGTLKPWHGVADAIIAASLATEPYVLRIIGDGPERAALESLATELEVVVDFQGAVAPEQIPTHLAGSWLAIAPYPELGGEHKQYFSPLKVYEYLAAGIPIVASSVGQIPQILAGIGTLVEPSNPAQLARVIDELLKDPTRRAELGRMGRARAEERHGWDAVVRHIFALAKEAQHDAR